MPGEEDEVLEKNLNESKSAYKHSLPADAADVPLILELESSLYRIEIAMRGIL